MLDEILGSDESIVIIMKALCVCAIKLDFYDKLGRQSHQLFLKIYDTPEAKKAIENQEGKKTKEEKYDRHFRR